MHRFLSLVLATAAMCATSALCQQTDTDVAPSHRVTWSFDPQRGTLIATPPAPTLIQGKLDSEALANATTTSTTFTGTILITATVKLISSVPKGATLLCSGVAGLEYEVEKQSTTLTEISFDVLQSLETAYATVSGNLATCRFSIPYSWVVPASSTSGTTKTTVTIQGVLGEVAIAENVLDANLGANVLRTVRSTFLDLTGPTTIPADGAKTPLTASMVL